MKKINDSLHGAKRNDPKTREAQERKTALEALRAELTAMKTEIIEVRNVMAHAKEGKNTDGKPILKSLRKGKSDIVLDDAYFSKTRKSILRHIQSTEDITRQLKSM